MSVKRSAIDRSTRVYRKLVPASLRHRLRPFIPDRFLQNGASADIATGSTQLGPTHEVLYPRLWSSPIFNHPRSFWSEGYGLALESYPAGKIVVFGFPKSGNVWINSLLIDYFGLPGIDPMLDVDKPGVGMTHRPFDGWIGNRPDFLHGVCIVRDARDVVASFYHYTKTQRFRSARPEYHYETVAEFYYDWFLSRAAPALKLDTVAEEYAELGVPIIRYEKLRADAEGELGRLLRRWGFDPDPERVRAAVAANDIDRLRVDGKMLDTWVAPEHFRRGGVGTHVEELPAGIIRDIERRYERMLRRWGYLQ
jgi:Sulfotransferase domain